MFLYFHQNEMISMHETTVPWYYLFWNIAVETEIKFSLHHIWDRVPLNTPGLKI